MQGESHNFNMFRLNLWARHFMHPAVCPPGMDGSSYLPTPLTSPAALMVFASSPDGGVGTPQLPPGHPMKGHTDKDVQMAGAMPMFRPGDHLPPHLYNPLHQSFLRPNMDPSLGYLGPRGGAFHFPCGVPGEDREGYHSAFVPTAKVAKMDELADASRTDEDRTHRSPANSDKYRLVSPRSDREHSSPALSNVGSVSSGSQSEAGDRATPDSDKFSMKWSFEGLRCPVCKAALQPGEGESHLAMEMQNLRNTLQRMVPTVDPATNRHKEENDRDSSAESLSRSRFETFVRVKGNREARLAKMRGRRKRLHDETSAMDSCCQTATPDAQRDNAEEETIDVIGYDEQDDADWLNERRGQQTEAAPGTSSQTPELEGFDQRSIQSRESTAEDLRTRNTIDKDKVRCSECREPYKNPVTSMQCWHVHCEACWIQSLGSKQACPQCNAVTSASDLRRIYI